MNQKRFWIAAGIIAAIILGGFALSVPHTTEVKEASLSAPEAAAVPPVALHDAYKKGVHTLTGSLMAPDACGQLSAAASLGGASTSPSISVALSLSDQPGVCLELPTMLPFKLTVSAPANIPIDVTVDGQPASTTSS